MLRYQIEFSAWADRRVLAAALLLTTDELGHDFKTSEHTILGTLVHNYRAERIWLGRIQGERLEFVSQGDETMAALSENWPLLTKRWLEEAQGIDQRADVPVNYHDLRGNPWTQPLWQIVHQVVNHSTHHRGQVIGFLRALGHQPPNVESITFSREP